MKYAARMNGAALTKNQRASDTSLDQSAKPIRIKQMAMVRFAASRPF